MKFIPREQLLTLEELAMISRAFVELGVDKIRITGGEPLIRRNVIKLFQDIGQLPGLRELVTTTNGSQAGNLDPPFMSLGHSGGQAMPLSYDNAGRTSEATMTLASKKDWTEHGVTKLSIWFRGYSANSPDRMFVALGNAVVYHPDDTATQDTGWNEWVIDLSEFANQGADLANVPSITLGFGTKNAPVPDGGTGTVQFDDIELIR